MSPLPLSQPSDVPTPIVRVSDLRQWVYCPRVVWWTHVCPVGKVESYKMKLGREKEQRLQRLQRRRTLRAFGLKQGQVESNVSLFSPQLGLTGKLDMLVRKGILRFPVEVKFTQGPARLNHRLQLAGYALLLESIYGVTVSHGYIVRLPDDTVDRMEIDHALRSLAWRTILAIRKTIATEQTPPAARNPSSCVDCEYIHFCGDVR